MAGVIYARSNGRVVFWVTPGQPWRGLDVELQRNVLPSYGGVAADYGWLAVPDADWSAVAARGGRVQGGALALGQEAASPGAFAVADGAVEYGQVDEVGPPILVTMTRSGEQVEAGRLAGYTPEAGHMVKLTRISGQWVVEDRVLLANA